MAIAWSGADPVEQADGSDYELGTQWRAVVDITLTHARVHATAGEVSIGSRRAHVWSTTGTPLGIAVVDDDLPNGWSDWAYTAPVEIAAGTNFVTSHMTGGNYGIVAGAFNANVSSVDGNVVGVRAVDAVNGNGVFNGLPGSFPANGSGGQHFYGSAFTYDVGIGGNSSPTITSLTANDDGLDVDVAVLYADLETSVGATARFDWGDGTPATTVTYPTTTASHTYALSGTYAVLCTVTDAGGLSDHAAVPVRVVAPDPDVQALDIVGITNALISIPMRTGLFDQVNGHDSSGDPTPSGMLCSLRFVDIKPTATSGLNITSAVVRYEFDLTAPFERGSKDLIDPQMLYATEQVMRGIVGAFTLDGGARMVDVHGADGGAPFEAVGGFVKTEDGGMILRIVTIRVPVIVNDVWEQVA